MPTMARNPPFPTHRSSGAMRRTSASSLASSWSRRTNSMKAYARRRRFWCAACGVVTLIAIIVGIVFTSHYYYHLFGGRDNILRRWPGSEGTHLASNADLFLPLRQASRMTSRFNRAERTIPFNVCGDQMNSCEAYNQLEICCPVTMVCHQTKYTNSGIFCCNATGTGCKITAAQPPKCLPRMFECSKDVGGGCCRDGWSCDVSGCTHPELNTTSSSTTMGTYPTISTAENSKNLPPISAKSSNTALKRTEGAIDTISGALPLSGAKATPSVVTPGAPTVTQPKIGEVASRGSAREAMRQLLMILPGSLLNMLSMMAIVFLML